MVHDIFINIIERSFMFKEALILISFSFLFSNTYTINSNESNIHWVGSKLTSEHFGQISIDNGFVQFDGNSIINAKVVINMNTLNVTDMDDSGNTSLERHLKNSDFFDIKSFPNSTFIINEKNKVFNNKGNVISGIIKIKNIELPIEVPMQIIIDDNLAIAIGEFEIDRTLFGITYGSGSYFSDLADRAINDNFLIKFSIVADRVIER